MKKLMLIATVLMIAGGVSAHGERGFDRDDRDYHEHRERMEYRPHYEAVRVQPYYYTTYRHDWDRDRDYRHYRGYRDCDRDGRYYR